MAINPQSDVSSMIAQQSQKMPFLENEVLAAGDLLAYIKSRSIELIKVYKNLDFYPSSIVAVIRDKNVTGLYKIFLASKTITLKVINPVRYFADISDYDSNTFYLYAKFDRQAPGGTDTSFIGVAYDRPASRAEYETRWVLQVLDKAEPIISEIKARCV